LLHVAPGATTGTAVDLGQAITLLFEDPSGDLWAAADAPGTLLRFDGSPTHHPEVLDGPATGVTGLVRGGFRARGTHWLTTRWDGASSGGSVFYSIDLATWQELTVPGLLGPLDRDFIDGCQASTGELWFMSALAVVRVDTDLRARRIPDGLLGLLEAHPLSLLAVECDGQGGVWFLQREALTRRDADGGWFRYLLPSSLPLCPDLRLPGNAGPSHLAVTAVGEVFLGTTCGVLALE